MGRAPRPGAHLGGGGDDAAGGRCKGVGNRGEPGVRDEVRVRIPAMSQRGNRWNEGGRAEGTEWAEEQREEKESTRAEI